MTDNAVLIIDDDQELCALLGLIRISLSTRRGQSLISVEDQGPARGCIASASHSSAYPGRQAAAVMD